MIRTSSDQILNSIQKQTAVFEEQFIQLKDATNTEREFVEKAREERRRVWKEIEDGEKTIRKLDHDDTQLSTAKDAAMEENEEVRRQGEQLAEEISQFAEEKKGLLTEAGRLAVEKKESMDTLRSDTRLLLDMQKENNRVQQDVEEGRKSLEELTVRLAELKYLKEVRQAEVDDLEAGVTERSTQVGKAMGR